MSIDMHIRIAGVSGGSQDAGYKGALDVLAFSWGASSSGTSQGGPGKVNIQDLSFTSYVDTATSDLLERLFKGSIVSSAVLTTVRQVSGAPLTDVYTMNEVLMTSASLGGSGGEDELTINYSLDFVSLDFRISGHHATWDTSTQTS